MHLKDRVTKWLNQSLGHRLILSSVATAFVLVVFLGISAVPLFIHQAWQNFTGQSNNEVHRVADQISLRLSVIEQNLVQLAQNSFVVNSLVDSTGRELYLQPTLRDFRLPFQMRSRVVVFDANLEPIGSSVRDPSDLVAASTPEARRALANQKLAVAVHRDDHGLNLIVAIPIYYPAASTYEGVLVGSLNAENLFAGANVSELNGCVEVVASSITLLRSGCREDMRPELVEQDLFGHSELAKSLSLAIAYSKDREPLYRYLASVLTVFLLIATAATIGIYLVSRRVGSDLNQQLALLSKTAQELAASPSARSRVVWNRPDEIGQLAKVFNLMVDSLQDLQASLEKRVAERTKELAASERHYASLAETAPVGIFRADSGGEWVYVNDLWCRMAELSGEEATGKGWIKSIHPKDQDRVTKAWFSAINEGCPFKLEYRLKQRNDTTRWVVGQAAAIEDESGTILGYVGTVSDITDRKVAQDQLERMAHYDGLTQLPNRLLLMDRIHQALAHAKRANTMVAVCYIDLDGFKAVNDIYGHEAGDKLLIEVARRLTHTLRGDDTVARLGGDEFVAVLPGLESVTQCEEVLQRTITALSEPVSLDHGTARISASVGVSFYPITTEDVEVLLRQADQAMYAAKQAGKNQYRLFDSEKLATMAV